MKSVDPFVQLSKRVSREEFVVTVPGHFLLKRPSTKRPGKGVDEIEYVTSVSALDTDPFAEDWLIGAVEKREGNPYPERISIGRATNCDIVIRVPFISKVHAHIIREPDGSVSLRNNQAAALTACNGRKLAPNTKQPIGVGDEIALGAMVFEFVDSRRLHEILSEEHR